MQTDRFSTYQSDALATSAIRSKAWDVFEAQRAQGENSPRQQPAQDEDDVGTLECFYD